MGGTKKHGGERKSAWYQQLKINREMWAKMKMKNRTEGISQRCLAQRVAAKSAKWRKWRGILDGWRRPSRKYLPPPAATLMKII
jgi:hypothetical protein